MPTFEFWIILSFLISAFPIVFLIDWIFPSEMGYFWELLNVGNSQYAIIPAFVFSFVMLIIGLFVDGLRHTSEWFVEWLENYWETYERMELFPVVVEIPDPLRDIIRYDQDKRLLIFKGVMSEEERETLKKLSIDKTYRNAF